MKKINQKDYKYYLLNKKTNKIDTGWEFKEDANDAKKEKNDDNFVVYTKTYLISKGIDPDLNKSWLNESLNEDVTITDPQLAQEFNNIQKQIIDKQNQINQINKDILVLEKNKSAITQKATQTQKTIQPIQTTAQQTQPTQNVTSQTKESYYNIKSLDQFLNESIDDPSEIDAMKILNVDNYDKDDEPDVEEIEDTTENFENNEDVFYVKIEDDNEEFICKIYRNEPNGEWYGSVKVGENPGFEKLSYEPNFDEDDILDFLNDNYDNAEILTNEEYDEHIKKFEKEPIYYDDILDIESEEY